jgi:hypothetical protein
VKVVEESHLEAVESWELDTGCYTQQVLVGVVEDHPELL